MLERTRPDITICSPSGAEIVTVPITPECRRVVKLMESDHITLEFRLASAVVIPVGSYADDEIFGRFFLTEEQLPSFDEKSACYSYKLQLNAWYWLWGMKQHMLTSTASGIRLRKEVEWTLTADLSTQAREVINNLYCLGYLERTFTDAGIRPYTNYFAARLEAVTGGGYEVKVYAKFPVAYDTFFCIHCYKDDGETEDDREVPVVIPRGGIVSHYEQPYTDAGMLDNNDSFDGITVDYDMEIEQISVARGYTTNGQASDGYRLRADVITTSEGAVAEGDNWVFYPSMNAGQTSDYSSFHIGSVTHRWIRALLETDEAIMDYMEVPDEYREDWLFTYENEQEQITLRNEVLQAQYGQERETTAWSTGYAATIDVSEDITTRLNALTISFNGDNILAALKNIADAFECEYWVTYDADSVQSADYATSFPTFTIHFGKCETGEEVTVCADDAETGINAESITASRDDSLSAQKYLAYGSKDNVPHTYRKKIYAECECTATDTQTGKHYAYFRVPHVTKGYKGYIDCAWFGVKEHADATLNISFPVMNLPSKSAAVNDDNNSVRERVTDSFYIHAGQYTFDDTNTDLETAWSGIQIQASCGFDESQADDPAVAVYLSVNLVQTDGSERTEIARMSASSGGYAAVAVWNSSAAWKAKEFYVRGGNYYVEVRASASSSENTDGTVNISKVKVDTAFSIPFTGKDASAADTLVEFDGMEYSVKFNPYEVTRPSVVKKVDTEDPFNTDTEYFIAQIPDDMDIEQFGKVIIEEDDSIDIPLAYFTQGYEDEASLIQIGERRLMLPENSDPEDARYWDDVLSPQWVCVDGAVVPYAYRKDADSRDLTEATLLMDKVYPNGKMKVARVITEDKQKNDETPDPEQNTWDWHQYNIKLVHAGSGAQVIFDKKYILEGYELGIRFLPPSDLSDEQRATTPVTSLQTGSSLSGMQFSVEYNKQRATFKPSGFNVTIPTEEGQSITDGVDTYTQADLKELHTIVRNSDFGALLPNDILKPSVGDACCLINWDVRAMASLGLVQAAEEELMRKAFEYAKEKQEGNTTFTCNMMSDFFFQLAGEYVKAFSAKEGREPIRDGEGRLLFDTEDSQLFVTHYKDWEALFEAEDKRLYVRNGYTVYHIPEIGRKVNIRYKPISGGGRQTRILGMELKLDKPYDTPRLICGETDAYSRIRQLEKEISRINNQ